MFLSFNFNNTSLATSIKLAFAVDRYFGRFTNKILLYSEHLFKISSDSEDTTTFPYLLSLKACSMVQKISGFPLKF